MPKDFGSYFEPFVGGGAVFLALAPETSQISDTNSRLTNLYTVVKENPSAFLGNCESLEAHYNSLDMAAQEIFFYKARDEFNGKTTDALRDATLFTFLNKAGFNGLYRENRAGSFNVPYGRRKKINLAEDANVERVSRLLQTAEIRTQGFQSVLSQASAGDLVYLDPPYVPLTSTSSFTAYQASGFGEPEQRELASAVQELTRKSVMVVASNSYTPLVKELYGEFNINQIQVARRINADAKGRGFVTEALITNF